MGNFRTKIEKISQPIKSVKHHKKQNISFSTCPKCCKSQIEKLCSKSVDILPCDFARILFSISNKCICKKNNF